MLVFWTGWTTHYPKNGGSYVLLDITPILLQTGIYLLFFKPCSQNVNHFGINGTVRVFGEWL